MEQDPEFVPEPNTFPVYSKSCFFKVQHVIEHSQKFKKNMQDFSTAFSKRIQAELTYQKNLLDCTKYLEKYIEPTSNKSVSYISSGFKVDNQQRAAQAFELANSLRTEVIEPVSQSIKDYGNTIKKIEKTAKKISKDYSYFSDNFERAYKSYKENDNIIKELIITKNIQKFTSEFSQDKKNKLISKTMENIKEKTEYQKNYRTAVSQFNELVQIYNKETKESLDQLQTKERELIKLQSDAIRKLIVCEVSMFKNVEYDLINISKQMEKMYAENDILQFRKTTEAMEQTEKDRNLETKVMESDLSLLNLSLRNVEEEYYPWLISVKKNKNLRKMLELKLKIALTTQKLESLTNEKKTIEQKNGEQGALVETLKGEQKEEIQSTETGNEADLINQLEALKKYYTEVWDSLPPEIFSPPPHPLDGTLYTMLKKEEVQKDFEQLSNLIHDAWTKQIKQKEQSSSSIISQGKKSKQSPKSSTFKPKKKNKHYVNLISKNHLLRILGYLFIEEYRIQHFVQMSARSYQKVGQLTSLLLDEAEDKKDVFVIKGILGLLFTFYSIENQKHKKLLYQHNLVKQVDVWKKNDFWEASIFESTYEEMAALAIQTGETQAETLLREKNAIFSQLASYCHSMLMLGVTSRQVRVIVGRYCRLYEMSDDQNRDLSKMIANTAKQIKQIQMLSQAKEQM